MQYSEYISTKCSVGWDKGHLKIYQVKRTIKDFFFNETYKKKGTNIEKKFHLFQEITGFQGVHFISICTLQIY